MRGFTVFVLLALLCVHLWRSCDAQIRKTPLDVSDPDVVKAAEYVMEELRPLCAYCSPVWKEAYEGLQLIRIISAESARSAFDDGTNYFMRIEIATERGQPYRGQHEVTAFGEDSGDWKGMSIDEFPQITPPDDEDEIVVPQ